MRLRAIPLVYTISSVVVALFLPRLEHAFFPSFVSDMSVASAQAFFSAVSSGVMALTGMVFAITFVVVQFSGFAYSPRLVVMFANNPVLFHSLGLFFATFSYSLVTLMWTDRGHAGTVPLFSSSIVVIMLLFSMLAFIKLMRSVGDLQIHNVIQAVSEQGRSVIQAMFPYDGKDPEIEPQTMAPGFPELGLAVQTLTFSGKPRVVASLDIDRLVRLAKRVDGVIAVECAVGDSLLEETVLLRVHRARRKISERALRKAIHLAECRTFEQDPKYAIRLLVDIAVRALSPAVNDPTTAVQTLDHIEDLLRRLGCRRLDAGRNHDAEGVLRLTYPVPTWEDYLALSFDEIRQYGASSVQVVRRMRSALTGLAEIVATAERRNAVRQYLDQLNQEVGRSNFDDEDKVKALEEDRQGLGLSRSRPGQKVETSLTRPARVLAQG